MIAAHASTLPNVSVTQTVALNTTPNHMRKAPRVKTTESKWPQSLNWPNSKQASGEPAKNTASQGTSKRSTQTHRGETGTEHEKMEQGQRYQITEIKHCEQ